MKRERACMFLHTNRPGGEGGGGKRENYYGKHTQVKYGRWQSTNREGKQKGRQLPRELKKLSTPGNNNVHRLDISRDDLFILFLLTLIAIRFFFSPWKWIVSPTTHFYLVLEHWKTIAQKFWHYFFFQCKRQVVYLRRENGLNFYF